MSVRTSHNSDTGTTHMEIRVPYKDIVLELSTNDQDDGPPYIGDVVNGNAPTDVQAMVLMHACWGIDVTLPGYVKGVQYLVESRDIVDGLWGDVEDECSDGRG